MQYNVYWCLPIMLKQFWPTWWFWQHSDLHFPQTGDLMMTHSNKKCNQWDFLLDNAVSCCYCPLWYVWYIILWPTKSQPMGLLTDVQWCVVTSNTFCHGHHIIMHTLRWPIWMWPHSNSAQHATQQGQIHIAASANNRVAPIWRGLGENFP